MADPMQTVNDFLDMWDEPGGFEKAVRAYFTDKTVYENVGLSKTIRIEEAVAFGETLENFTGANGFIRVRTTAAAANGKYVLNECFDDIVVSIPLMGIFVIEDGKIAEWRDYADTAGFNAAMAGEI